MIREFLTSNVLDQLPAELRDFLVATSVLGVLNGQLCDWYLGRQGSQTILLELHRRRLFTLALDGESSFRYHEVLRAHLEGVLVDEIGEDAVQERCRHAGTLLEETGALPEALRAYSRAGDAEAVARLLGRQGAALADQPGHWIESLPPALLENDPWLLLALARRHAAGGRTNAALDAYRRAEAGFAGRAMAEVCRDERLTLQSWVTPASTHPRDDHWLSALRTILETPAESRSARPAPSSGARAVLIASLSDLVAGRLREAREQGLGISREADATTALVAAGLYRRRNRGAAARRSGRCRRPPSRRGSGREHRSRMDRADGSCRAVAGDLRRPPVDRCRRARLSACTMAIDGAPRWRCSSRAPGDTTASTRRRSRSSFSLVSSSTSFVPVASSVSLAISRTARGRRGACRRWTPIGQCRASPLPVIELRCFGGLSASVDGQAIDLSAVKPRVRSLLRLLGAQAGAPVHREVICDALWPEADPLTGLRNLQVAVSSLRRLLEPRVSRGGGALVVRDGDSYRLALPGNSTCDVVTYRSLLTRAMELSTTRSGGGGRRLRHCRLDAACWASPEEGPTEWAEAMRERCRADVSAVGLQLAERALSAGDPACAAAICTDVVGVDRYVDPAWRLLILAKERSGDDAAARLTRRRYSEILEELGVHGENAERPDRAIAAAR